MKVAWFWADLPHEWISSMWRVQFPHTGLLGAGIESKQDDAHELLSGNWHPFNDWADTIIIERLLFGPWLDHIKRWKKEGKRVFTTFDDAYWIMPDYMRSKQTWNKETLAQFFGGLKIVDGIFVPSAGLVDELRNFGVKKNKIHLVPNYIDLTFPGVVHALNSKKLRMDLPAAPAYRQAEAGDRFVIGWGGSHHHSLEPLIPIFKKIVKIEPRVQIWILGNFMAYNMLGDISLENKRFFSVLPYGNYLAMVKEFDVFAIPLHGRYDKCRSWIKPLESALMGVPWVATYNKIYRDCQGGRLVQKENEWVEALLSPVVADTEWALQQDITKHTDEYLEVLNG